MRIEKRYIKVYLEGYPIDVNAITLTETEDSPATAQIILPPDARAVNLLPRTLCHIFYLVNDTDSASDDDYVLIFEGELSSISFSKHASQKVCTLAFIALTANWRNHYIRSADANAEITFDQCTFLMLNGNTPMGSMENYSEIEDDPVIQGAIDSTPMEKPYFVRNTAFTIFQIMGDNFLPKEQRPNNRDGLLYDNGTNVAQFNYVYDKIKSACINDNFDVSHPDGVWNFFNGDKQFITNQFELFKKFCAAKIAEIGGVDFNNPSERLRFLHYYNGTGDCLNTYAIPAFRLANLFSRSLGTGAASQVLASNTTETLKNYYRNINFENHTKEELVSFMNNVDPSSD